MLDLDSFDVHLCRFVQEYHYHGKMCPILSLLMNSKATIQLRKRNQIHGLHYRLGRAQQAIRLRNSIVIGSSQRNVYIVLTSLFIQS
jgi:hypothetical protein